MMMMIRMMIRMRIVTLVAFFVGTSSTVGSVNTQQNRRAVAAHTTRQEADMTLTMVVTRTPLVNHTIVVPRTVVMIKARHAQAANT